MATGRGQDGHPHLYSNQKETIYCECGRVHYTNPYSGGSRTRQPSPDHPEFNRVYGNNTLRPSELRTDGERCGVLHARAVADSAGTTKPAVEPSSRSLPESSTNANHNREPVLSSTVSSATSESATPSQPPVASNGSHDTPKQPNSPSDTKLSAQELGDGKQEDCKCDQQLQQSVTINDVLQLPDRDWPVRKILESKRESGRRLFKVQWGEIECPRQFLNASTDGKFSVMIDCESWLVESFEETTCNKCSMPLYKVNWKATWKHERDLPNMQELIDEFVKVDGPLEPDESTGEQSIRLCTPGLRPLPLAAEPQETGRSSPAPETASPVISSQKFQPRGDIEYQGSHFRGALSRFSNGPRSLLGMWTEDMDQRALVFRPRYLALRNDFDLGRREKARGVVSYFCGAEQQRPCECCEKGSGPFEKCVVSIFSINGACANCQCSGNARQCNFHSHCESISTHPVHWAYKFIANRQRWQSSFQSLPTPPCSSSPLRESSTDPVDEPSSPTARQSPEPSDLYSQAPQYRRPAPGPFAEPSEVPASPGYSEDTKTESIATERSAGVDGDHATIRSSPLEHDHPNFEPIDDGLNVQTPNRKHSCEDNLAAPLRKRFCTEASFCPSTAREVWREESFRHETCDKEQYASCKAFDNYSRRCCHEREIAWAARRVMDARQFKVGEATEGEVRYILRKCPCNFIESFNEGWQSWTYENAAEDWSKERFIAHFYSDQLNEAKERFCPQTHQEHEGKEIILID